MLSLRLGAVDQFPFLDPPRTDAINDGYKTLFEIQAIDHERKLTDVGQRLAKMPVDPRIGRMILAGAAPLEAVQLQIIVMYMLIGAAAFTGLSATFLSYRQFFTAAHQLVISETSSG